MRAFDVLPIDDALRKRVQPIVDGTWGAPFIAVDGRLWDTRVLPGFAAVCAGEPLGYLLYALHGGCEIMALESVERGIGVGSALIERVKRVAKDVGAGRLTVCTTNDNVNAFRFYQRRGFALCALRVGAIDDARRLKPSIPLVGEDGIPLRDELVFEFAL
uniref:Acetyltransferase, GNAT family n=1 Tax=uncultured bacterium contig00006 TaxID=1181498 RepID=A0A806KG89_9BACT|nr:acetyltransferase, GNAT family [uncultured bacterium contig00006]